MPHPDDYFRSPKSRDPQVEDQWYEQACFEDSELEDWDTAAEVEIPAELDAFQVLADADEAFDSHWVEWVAFACETGIFLPIEQSCEEGILLPTEQRAIRLATCPEDMLKPLRRFFEGCPRHVKHLICHYVYWWVRIERARRTGDSRWRPVLASRSA